MDNIKNYIDFRFLTSPFCPLIYFKYLQLPPLYYKCFLQNLNPFYLRVHTQYRLYMLFLPYIPLPSFYKVSETLQSHSETLL